MSSPHPVIQQRLRLHAEANRLSALVRFSADDRVRIDHSVKRAYLHGSIATIIDRIGYQFVLHLR